MPDLGALSGQSTGGCGCTAVVLDSGRCDGCGRVVVSLAACPRCGDPGYSDVLGRRFCGNPGCPNTEKLPAAQAAGDGS